jgi:hypothetical protein
MIFLCWSTILQHIMLLACASELPLFQKNSWLLLRGNRGRVTSGNCKNFIERSVILSTGVVLSGSPPTLPHAIPDGSKWSKASTPVTLKQAERSHILDTLQQTDGLVGGRNGAAARLGVPRTTLIYKMKRLGILSTIGPNLGSSSPSGLSAEWNFS